MKLFNKVLFTSLYLFIAYCLYKFSISFLPIIILLSIVIALHKKIKKWTILENLEKYIESIIQQ